MAEKCSERRIKLLRAQRVLNALIDLNELCSRTNSRLKDQGLSTTEIETTLNAMLDGAGPPKKTGPAALDECTGDKVTDRLINMLNSNVVDGVDWDAEAE